MTDFKKFKALVSDFDGTLADTSLIPSKEVKEAIIKLVNKGYIFSIATGRIYPGAMKSVCESLNLTSPQIISGGSVIIDPKTLNLFWFEYIPVDTAKKIVNDFLNNNFEFAVDSQGKYIFTPNGLAVKVYGLGVAFKKIAELDFRAVSKITLEGSCILNLQEKADELSNKFSDLYIVRSGMKGLPVLDITSIKATKFLAVLELSKILKIDPKLMIGVGDGYNDYPLLSACGLKATMGSAPTELKEIADIILPDVSKNGLVTLINNLI